MHIGKKLLIYIKKNFDTKSEYARAIGVSPQLLNGYLKSPSIRWGTLEKMSNQAGMTPMEFALMLEGLTNE
jgi:hypothetical protein